MTATIGMRARQGLRWLCSALVLSACDRPAPTPVPVPAASAASAPTPAAPAASAPERPPVAALPSHALDGPTAGEFSAVVKLLLAAKPADDKSFFPRIELFEPDKATVLAWTPGSPLQRRAYVNFKGPQGAQEAVVNLASGQVEKASRLDREPMVMLEEFMGSMNLALADPGFVAGLARRGFKPADVFCLPRTAGSVLQQAEKGKRLMKVPCYQNPTGSNFYARPIEGLLAEVDLNTRKVVGILDEGVVPVAKDGWGYTEAEVAKRARIRPAGNPVEMVQRQPNFVIKGSQIAWDLWRFHYRADKRPGIVLS